jgi:hypothetical protein
MKKSPARWETFFVASSGIEPESGASETLILSIVLRGQNNLKFQV